MPIDPLHFVAPESVIESAPKQAESKQPTTAQAEYRGSMDGELKPHPLEFAGTHLDEPDRPESDGGISDDARHFLIRLSKRLGVEPRVVMADEIEDGVRMEDAIISGSLIDSSHVMILETGQYDHIAKSITLPMDGKSPTQFTFGNIANNSASNMFKGEPITVQYNDTTGKYVTKVGDNVERVWRPVNDDSAGPHYPVVDDVKIQQSVTLSVGNFRAVVDTARKHLGKEAIVGILGTPIVLDRLKDLTVAMVGMKNPVTIRCRSGLDHAYMLEIVGDDWQVVIAPRLKAESESIPPSLDFGLPIHPRFSGLPSEGWVVAVDTTYTTYQTRDEAQVAFEDAVMRVGSPAQGQDGVLRVEFYYRNLAGGGWSHIHTWPKPDGGEEE